MSEVGTIRFLRRRKGAATHLLAAEMDLEEIKIIMAKSLESDFCCGYWEGMVTAEAGGRPCPTSWLTAESQIAV